jgi:hypothetical protein
LFHALVVVGASLTGAATGCSSGVDANAAADAAADGENRGYGMIIGQPYNPWGQPQADAGGAGSVVDSGGARPDADASHSPDSAAGVPTDAGAGDGFYGNIHNIPPCAAPPPLPPWCPPLDAGGPDGKPSHDGSADASSSADAYPTIQPAPPPDAYPIILPLMAPDARIP